MDGGIPVIAVLGHRKSGKTTVVETLISELVSRGYRPASAKHISHKGFSMDALGRIRGDIQQQELTQPWRSRTWNQSSR